MVVSELTGLIADVGKIALLLQALGIIVILWIIFESASLWINYRRYKEVMKIKDDMRRLERKLDRALKK